MSKKEHKEHKSRMKLGFFRGFRKSTTDLSEWNKNDEKLMKAVEGSDIAKVDHLLHKKTLNMTKLGPKGLSVFHVACSLGQTQIVDHLINNGAEVNTLSIQGNTALQLAARDGWPQVVERLIQGGGVIDHKDGLSLTALHHACARGQVECVRALLKHGADSNSRDKTGKPSLFYAAYSGDLPICKELLDRGANVNGHDEQQLTPLMAAAKKGHAEVCELLLKKGADPTIGDLQGHDALSYGLDAGYDNLKTVFSKAPTRASWDVHQSAPTTNGMVSQVTVSSVEAPVEPAEPEPQPQTPEAEVDAVAEFVPEPTPELQRKSSESDNSMENSEVIQILGDSVPKGGDDDDEVSQAASAASPPQAIIDQRALEAYKELEEENEHITADLHQMTSQHRKLQDAYDTLKKQLAAPATPHPDQEEVQELEDELQNLKTQLLVEQEKNEKMGKRVEKLKRHPEIQAQKEGSGEDSWNDSDDDELFTSPQKPVVIDHKPQTLLLLQNQVSQLRQDNKHLRERLQSNQPMNSLFGRRDTAGSVSSMQSGDESADVERLKKRLEEMQTENIYLQQLQENAVFPEEQRQNTMVLEQENTQLHSETKQLRTEINLLKLSSVNNNKLESRPGVGQDDTDDSGVGTSDLNKSFDSAINTSKLGSSEKLPLNIAISNENDSLRTENSLLTEELESLRDTYNKLVLAGDNLQDMYDQLVMDKEQVHEELEQVGKEKQELVKENEYLLSDGNAMHDDIEKLVQEMEKLHEKNQAIQKEKEEVEKKLNALNVAGKASDIARIIEERDKLQTRLNDVENMSSRMKHDHDIVLEEVQSLQAQVGQMDYERDQVQQEFDSLQDEFENVQQQQDGLQQDYTQLEQDYADLLADKEKLEHEFLDVQTANVVHVEQQNPQLETERDTLKDDNGVLLMEKEQLEMTIKELSRSNALLQEELSSLKDALKLNEKESSSSESVPVASPTISTSPLVKESTDKMIDNVVEKDRRIRSLQIQISRLQQQLAEADHHYRDVINTYRTHLLSAVQGHMDPDVRQALYNIIELRGMEQYC